MNKPFINKTFFNSRCRRSSFLMQKMKQTTTVLKQKATVLPNNHFRRFSRSYVGLTNDMAVSSMSSES